MGQQRLVFRTYKTPAGARVVDDELRALGDGARAALLELVARRRVSQHFAREDAQVRGKLRELRTTYDGCEYRLYYARIGDGEHVLLALRAVNKKAGKALQKDIDLALSRLATWVA